jgi:transposase
MTKKHINHWIMYHEIHRLSRLGLKKAKISRYLNINVRTVGKYLAMSESEYEQHLTAMGSRNKVLSSYQEFVKGKLEEFPDTSAAQIHDWLKESYPDLPKVCPRTVYNFVMFVRQTHNIPYIKPTREFFPVEQLPYGDQAQVDFGEYSMRSYRGRRKKVYFFSMVLSRSRMKHIWFIDTPFTAAHVCEAHEKAFAFFGGITRVIVYDLDRAMVVDENLGDVILTATFRQYVQSRSFNQHFCRKADPQSKGKVENVVQYVKKNFLYNRLYEDIDTLNTQALAWLERTANFLEHNVTKKSPADEFAIEKDYLDTYVPIPVEIKEVKIHQVRKDNTIAYKSNFYTVPMGTYQSSDSKVIIKENNQSLEIYDMQEQLICTHTIYSGKGQIITNSNHKRDTSKSLKEMMDTVSKCFTKTELAMSFLLKTQQKYPRYIRDHLQIMIKLLTKEQGQSNTQTADKTLVFCLNNKIFNATDFESIYHVNYAEMNAPPPQFSDIKPLGKQSLDKANQKPQTSDLNLYENFF